MDALANGWVGSMDPIMVGAWMLCALDSWFGHGCTVHSQDLGMDALANEWVGSMDVGTMQT